MDKDQQLENNMVFSKAVPLCLPSNYAWDPNKKKLLIDGSLPRGDLTICQTGCEVLNHIGDNLVAIVCITGPARSGKSFFLSQIQDGVSFEIGHHTVSQTTGVWIALGPESVQVGEKTARLVLLDAEGLDAVSTADTGGTDEWDRKVFSLCTLVSSYLIYNSKGIPNNNDLDKLGFIAKFSEAIYNGMHLAHGDKDKDPEQDFKQFAPHFLWLIRDAHLVPQVGGKECDWETFVRKAVLDIPKRENLGDGADNTRPKKRSKEEIRRNSVRRAILQTFQSFDAFGLPSPSSDPSILQNLSLATNEESRDLNESFVKDMVTVKNKIISKPILKKIQGCFSTGRTIVDLLQIFVGAINNECDSLCVEDMWTSVVKSQLSYSKNNAFHMYTSTMELMKLPQMEEKLLECHESTLAEVLSVFHKQSSRFDKDIIVETEKSLEKEIVEKFASIKTSNKELSKEMCYTEIKLLEQTHFSKFEKNAEKYSCKDLTEAKTKMMEDYYRVAKGPMINTVKEERESRMEDKIPKFRLLILNATEKSLNDFLKGKIDMIHDSMPLEKEIIEKEMNEIEETFKTVISEKFDDCETSIKFKHNILNALEERLRAVIEANASSSSMYCQKVADKLKAQHLDSALASFLTKSYSEIKEVRETILRKFDEEAKGPAKLLTRQKCEEDISRQLMIAETSIVNASHKDVATEYRSKMRKIIMKGPYETDELEALNREIVSEIMEAFRVRCEGIEERESKESKVLKEIEKDKDMFLKENLELSLTKCETVMINIEQEIKTHCQTLVAKLSDDDVGSEVKVGFQVHAFKEMLYKKFDEEAKGPEKKKLKEKCMKEIERLLQEFEVVAANIALKNCKRHYQMHTNSIAEQGPYDLEELKEKELKVATRVLEYFRNICSEFRKSAYEKELINLEGFLADQNKSALDLNIQKSRLVCETVKNDIIRQFQANLQNLLQTLDIEADVNIALKLEKVREDHLQKYDIDAKGPEKQSVREKCAEEMNAYLLSAKKDLVNFSVNLSKAKYRSSCDDVINGGPHDEKDFQEMKDIAAAGAWKIINDRGIDLDKFAKAAQVQDLELFMKDHNTYIDQRNNDMSREVCEKQKVITLRKSQERFQTIVEEINSQDLQSVVEVVAKLQNQKEVLLDNFENAAKGPKKNEIRESVLHLLGEHVANAEQAISDSALRKATEMYQSNLLTITEIGCESIDDLHQKEAEAATKVINLFKERCKGFQEGIITTKVAKLEEFIKKQDANAYDHRFQTSLESCENVRKMVVNHYKIEMQNMLGKLVAAELKEIGLIVQQFNELNTKCMEKYESTATGFAKLQVQVKCNEEISEMYVSVENNIADILLEKAEENYQDIMTDIIKQGPHDEVKMRELESTAASRVIQLFREGCVGMTHLAKTLRENTLKKFIQDHNANANHRNVDKSRELCEALKTELVHKCQKTFQRTLHEIYEQPLELSTNKILFLNTTVKNLNASFKNKAKGPLKAEYYEKIAEELNVLTNSTSMEIVSTAIRKAQELYHLKVKMILREGPHETDTLEKLEMEICTNILQSFSKMCNGMDQITYNKHKSILEAHMKDEAANLVQLNFEESRKLCESIKTEALKLCKRSCKECFFNVQKQQLEVIGSTGGDLTAIQKQIMGYFCSRSIGPAKEGIKKTLDEEIQVEILTTMTKIADIVIVKCKERYKAILEDFLSEGPVEEQELKTKSEDTVTTMWKTFLQTCQGFDDFATLSHEHNFKVSVKELESKITYFNADSSREVCSRVKDKLVQESKQHYDQFIKDISTNKTQMEHLIGKSSQLRLIKEQLLEQYDQHARGTARKEIKEICRDGIEVHFKNAKSTVVHIILKKAKDKFKNSISDISNQNPQSEADLRQRASDASVEVLQFFEEACLGFEQAFINEKQETLEHFIDNQMKYAVGCNISASEALCENLKVNHLKTCQERFEQVVTHINAIDLDSIPKELQKLNMIKTEILESFETKGNSPGMGKLCSKLKEEMEELCLAAEKDIAEIAFNKAKNLYKSKMDAVLKGFPVENEYLQQEELKASNVTEQIDAICREIDESVTVSHRQELCEFQEKYKNECFAENRKVSYETCNTIRVQTINKSNEVFQGFLDELKSQEFDNRHDILSRVLTIEQESIDFFSSKAKGPGKVDEKNKLMDDLTNQKIKFQAKIANDTLKKATETYDTMVQKILSSCPQDDKKIIREHSKGAEDIKYSFNCRVSGFEKSAYETQANKLSNSISYGVDELIEKNQTISLEFCKNLLDDLLQDEECDTIEMLQEMYNELARGPKVKEALEGHKYKIQKKFRGRCRPS